MSIDRLAAKINATPVNARGRRRYPEALRREIMAALAASGLKRDEFASRVGVPSVNLSNWKSLALRKPAERKESGFKTIAVAPEPKAPGHISLQAPGGLVIEGLSVAAAAELIAAISGRQSC